MGLQLGYMHWEGAQGTCLWEILMTTKWQYREGEGINVVIYEINHNTLRSCVLKASVGKLLINTLDWPSINTWSTSWQHSINISINTWLVLDWQSFDSWLSVNQLIGINGVSVNSKLVNWLWLIVDQDQTKYWLSIYQWLIEGIEGIHQHSTTDACKTHDHTL